MAAAVLVVGVMLLSGCASKQNTTRTQTTGNRTGNLTNRTGNITGGGTNTSNTTAKSVTISLSAQNIKFNQSSISVPAGAQVTVKFNNMDNGVQHTFSVYSSSAATNAIFKGQAITGPSTTTYTFTAPSTPGTYYFRCDVHPTQMFGDFIVT